MPDLKTMATELETMRNRAKLERSELEALEAKGTPAPADRKEALNQLVIAGIAKQEEFDTEKKRQGFLDGNASENPEPKAREHARNGGYERAKSVGRTLVGSDEYKTIKPRASKNMTVEIQPFGSGEDFDVKLLREGLTSAGGAAVYSDRQVDIVDNARLRPVTLLDIINISGTNSSSIDYVALTGFTNNAAETAEWDGSSNYAAYAESDATFALRNAPVQSIGHYIRTSKRLVEDAPALENLVNTKMMDGVKVRLEGQCISGNGSAPNLTGILNTSGIQTRVMSTSAPTGRGQQTNDTKADTLRRGITDIRLAFYEPDAILMNPADGEALELLKDSTNNYMMIYDPVSLRIWRVKVVETAAITSLTTLIGAFRQGATLYVREDVQVEITDVVNDDKLRDAARILAAMRAALAVTDAPAFEKVTLI